jgi:hypothetical protein
MACTISRKSLDREKRVQLAISDYKIGYSKSLRQAAKAHYVTVQAVTNRLNSMTAKSDTIPKSRKLSERQEDAIVKYILYLNARGFPPKLRYVQGYGRRAACPRLW